MLELRGLAVVARDRSGRWEAEIEIAPEQLRVPAVRIQYNSIEQERVDRSTAAIATGHLSPILPHVPVGVAPLSA